MIAFVSYLGCAQPESERYDVPAAANEPTAEPTERVTPALEAEIVTPKASQEPVETQGKVVVQPAPVPPETKYWLTSSTRIRHNAGCRYYRKSKGMECGPDDGQACKICGG